MRRSGAVEHWRELHREVPAFVPHPSTTVCFLLPSLTSFGIMPGGRRRTVGLNNGSAMMPAILGTSLGLMATMKLLAAGLVAGEVALAVNMAVLGFADEAGISTAHGGLLRLATVILGLSGPNGEDLKAGFHVVIGLGMAMLYATAVGGARTRHQIVTGTVAAAAVWLLNAVIVLPLNGEGLAGWRRIEPEGVIWFAVAHTLFFLVLAVLVARLRPITSTDAHPGAPV